MASSLEEHRDKGDELWTSGAVFVFKSGNPCELHELWYAEKGFTFFLGSDAIPAPVGCVMFHDLCFFPLLPSLNDG